MARKRLKSILARHRLGESTPRRESGVDDLTRTYDYRNHNPWLYQLSYAHHDFILIRARQRARIIPRRMARPAGLEPATLGLEGRCSIQMSYGRRQLRLDARRPCPNARRLCIPRGTTSSHTKVVGVEGFEPTTSCSQSRRATRLRYTPSSIRTWSSRRALSHPREVGDNTHRPCSRQYLSSPTTYMSVPASSAGPATRAATRHRSPPPRGRAGRGRRRCPR